MVGQDGRDQLQATDRNKGRSIRGMSREEGDKSVDIPNPHYQAQETGSREEREQPYNRRKGNDYRLHVLSEEACT